MMDNMEVNPGEAPGIVREFNQMHVGIIIHVLHSCTGLLLVAYIHRQSTE